MLVVSICTMQQQDASNCMEGEKIHMGGGQRTIQEQCNMS